MFSIVYGSTATTRFGSIDLAELLTQCRVRNRSIGVTGMLMHEEGRFLQALEGPELVVRELMDRIEQDPRHDHVEVLAQETIASRRFPDWSMGYDRLDEVEQHSVEVYTDALAGIRREQPGPASRLQQLTDWFRRGR